MTTTPRRSGFKWNTTEILSLQRDYELLELTIQDIALKHERSVEGILYKLYNEQLINDFHLARGYSEFAESVHCDSSSDYEEDLVTPSIDVSEDVYDSNCISLLTERVNNLETSVNDINYILTKILRNSIPKSKRKLRNQSSYFSSSA